MSTGTKNTIGGVEMKNNERRSKKYRALRRAGFNSREANKYKDKSIKKVNEIIKRRLAFNNSIEDL